MNKKQIIFALIIFVLSLPLFAQNNGFAPFPNNKGTIYEYDNPPEICFFPTDKAKWDGYKVANKDWGRLTDFQKAMFVVEGIKEIETKNDVIIEYKGGAIRIVKALNTLTHLLVLCGDKSPVFNSLLSFLKEIEAIKTLKEK